MYFRVGYKYSDKGCPGCISVAVIKYSVEKQLGGDRTCSTYIFGYSPSLQASQTRRNLKQLNILTVGLIKNECILT